MTTRPDLDALEQLANEAPAHVLLEMMDHYSDAMVVPDAVLGFYHAARTGLPALVAEVRRLGASERALLESFHRVTVERDAAVQRAADMERATVAGIVAWLDDVEGRPIGAGTLRDFGLQDYANRVDAFRELFAGALRAGAWRGKGAP